MYDFIMILAFVPSLFLILGFLFTSKVISDLKVYRRKSHFLLNELHKMEKENAKLDKEKIKLKDKIENLDEKIKELKRDDFEYQELEKTIFNLEADNLRMENKIINFYKQIDRVFDNVFQINKRAQDKKQDFLKALEKDFIKDIEKEKSIKEYKKNKFEQKAFGLDQIRQADRELYGEYE